MNLAAQRLDLLLHARPHVAGLDHRAQPLGRGDRLQAGDADAEDDDARRLHGAGRRHQHREEALVEVGRHHDRLVAGDIGLAESTSMLCARVVRGAASRAKPVRPAAARRLEAGAVERVEHADQRGAALHQAQLVGRRGAHLQHEVGAKAPARSVISAPARVRLVGDAGGNAGADSTRTVWPCALSFLVVSGVRHARLAGRRLERHPYQHVLSDPSSAIELTRLRPHPPDGASARRRPAALAPANVEPPPVAAIAAGAARRQSPRIPARGGRNAEGLRLNNPAGHLDPGESPIQGASARRSRKPAAPSPDASSGST